MSARSCTASSVSPERKERIVISYPPRGVVERIDAERGRRKRGPGIGQIAGVAQTGGCVGNGDPQPPLAGIALGESLFALIVELTVEPCVSALQYLSALVHSGRFRGNEPLERHDGIGGEGDLGLELNDAVVQLLLVVGAD
jgi:hypothetical protein